MPRFFIEKEALGESSVTITGQDAVHIGRSLRMRLGDEVTVCCEGVDRVCRLTHISDESCLLDIVSVCEDNGEPGARVTLFQAVPKGDKLDLIVQKCVELGVTEIMPVLTERCVSRPDAKSWKKKQQRLERIALEAAKQCGRSLVPRVGDLIGLSECIDRMRVLEKPLACYELDRGKGLGAYVGPGDREIGILIGSEGGFSAGEVEQLRAAGIPTVSLGKRILRCETAPIAALSVIMALTGDLGEL